MAAPPRRVGHVVFGSTDVASSVAFYRDGIGMLVSDMVGGGIGCFLRCSSDHHNLLLMPAPVPCLNHYAVEMDDVDAIGSVGMRVVSDHPDATVYGIGRHVLGANLFWYLLDPAGGMFELFADMDQITDDERWESEQRRDDWDPFTIASWEPAPSTPDFFLPADIEDLARARQAVGR
jgi:catechol-2,3-dioxygenase